ncbi:MAG: PilZ domain-containing protein [Myxococcota bacterium]|nr:PilZ domain-containing protein [Myxococcota bacterium]
MRPEAQDQRRNLYRVEVGSSNPVEVTLSVRGWPAISSRLCDATANGVGLAMPSHVPLPIVEGQDVELTIWLLNQNRAVTVHGTIVGQHETATGRRVGIRFNEPQTVYRELSGNLGVVFNRRNAPRVAPEIGTRVSMLPAQASAVGPVEGTVHSISSSGLGITLRPTDHSRLDGESRLSIALSLRGIGDELPVSGIVKHISQRAGRVLYGVAFDDGPSDDGSLGQIDSYVMQRRASLMGELFA